MLCCIDCYNAFFAKHTHSQSTCETGMLLIMLAWFEGLKSRQGLRMNNTKQGQKVWLILPNEKALHLCKAYQYWWPERESNLRHADFQKGSHFFKYI